MLKNIHQEKSYTYIYDLSLFCLLLIVQKNLSFPSGHFFFSQEYLCVCVCLCLCLSILLFFIEKV
jgi:hypothetical protein